MSKLTSAERLIVIEEQMQQNGREHKAILKQLDCLNTKLDKAIETKASQQDLDVLRNRLWAFAMIFVTAFMGVVVFMLKEMNK